MPGRHSRPSGRSVVTVGARLGRTVLSATLAALVLAAPAAGRQASLRTGFYDPVAYQAGAEDRQVALAHTRAARGSIIRIAAGWRGRVVSQARPASSAQARDPDWLGYRWDDLDPVVRDVAAAGLEPFLTFTGAPDWAEGPGRPPLSVALPGTWRPSPADYRDFAEAVARRYSGRFPDPQRPGRFLPRVRHWQAWNEPNLTIYLTPQWETRGGRTVPSSPGHYRRLLNAFYAGVKAVDRTNVVVSAGTAPFGDPVRGGRRMAPALFTRELLCVRGRARLRAFSCPGGPARFDVLAHHPYSTGPPSRRAFNLDDVSVPDLGKLTRPLAVAVRAGNVFPRRAKRLWATELSWDSRPPDPGGVPQSLHARYVAGALYSLWRQRVDVVTWLFLRDAPEGAGFRYTFQSGIYERGDTVADDRPKLAFRAFRFPFTAYRQRGVVRLWGLAPGGGRVTVERRARGGWRAVRRLRARSDRLFTGRLAGVRRGTLLRARRRAETSLSWRVR